MKVIPLLAFSGEMLVEEIHQPGFAAPDTAPQVNTFDVTGFFAPEPAEQPGLPLPLQFVPEIIQGGDNE